MNRISQAEFPFPLLMSLHTIEPPAHNNLERRQNPLLEQWRVSMDKEFLKFK